LVLYTLIPSNFNIPLNTYTIAFKSTTT
jgi:hypothetical protein